MTKPKEMQIKFIWTLPSLYVEDSRDVIVQNRDWVQYESTFIGAVSLQTIIRRFKRYQSNK